jgi:diadenosine tetraphosphate (Ap4A) HIT family hydrolase
MQTKQYILTQNRIKKFKKIRLCSMLWRFFKIVICLGVFMASTVHATSAIVFQSRAHLQQALKPLSVEEVVHRVATSTASIALNFQYDEELSQDKIIPLRNPGAGNLLKTELYKAKTLTIFYPEAPRVPHHLTIALNRRKIRGIASVSEEENAELFSTIKKISDVYKSLSIHGFVIAQFDSPQDGHFGRYVVEIIPHLPGFKDVKNIVDKVDCNRHVLFRTANLSPIKYKIQDEEILKQAQFWKEAFRQDYSPLSKSDATRTLPYTRMESHQLEAEKILYHQLLEILQDKGGKVIETLSFEPEMPTTPPEMVKTVQVERCAFCDEAVIERQLVYEYNDVCIFYNMRKGAKPGSCFLVLPKRHTEKVYGLTFSEIHNIGIARAALVEVLKETHPECEVVVYTQDDPAVGQTVFHSHEQVVAVDPKTIALTWTMMSLYPSGNVSSEEMLKVREEFGLKLQQKIKPIEQLKEAI